MGMTCPGRLATAARFQITRGRQATIIEITTAFIAGIGTRRSDSGEAVFVLEPVR